MSGQLKISVLTNFILIALVLWMAKQNRIVQITSVRSDVTRSNIVSETPFDTSALSKPEAATLGFNTFRWSQIEASDYPTYIANLRSIGCPEQTVRDIIAADLDTIYAPRRRELDQFVRTGRTSRLEMDAKLATLRREEETLLASLLGDRSEATSTTSEAKPVTTPIRSTRPVMPLVFTEMDAGFVQLNEAQQAGISEVRKKFKEEIGTEAPDDPAYRERWFKAQRNADDRLRGMLGAKLFNQIALAQKPR